jgi:hypothetical protein
LNNSLFQTFDIATLTTHLLEILHLNDGAAPEDRNDLQYCQGQERQENLLNKKNSMTEKLKKARLSRRAAKAKEQAAEFSNNPAALVGKRILHQAHELGQSSQWYPAAVIDIFKSTKDPFKTEFTLHYDEDEPNDTWHFPLLADLRNGDLIVL